MSSLTSMPTTLAGIKHRARDLKKSQGLLQHQALDLAAQLAGFQNYQHACRAMACTSPAAPGMPPRYAYNLTIRCHWHDRHPVQRGDEVVMVGLNTAVTELWGRNTRIYGCGRPRRGELDARLDAMEYQTMAASAVRRVGRALRFMDTTGLRPSRDYARAYPQQWLGRGARMSIEPPGGDHGRAWRDPASGGLVLTDEPYLRSGGVAELLDQRAAWCEEHGYQLAASPWDGIHNPSADGTRLILLSKTVPLGPLIEALAGLPQPVVEGLGEQD